MSAAPPQAFRGGVANYSTKTRPISDVPESFPIARAMCGPAEMR